MSDTRCDGYLCGQRTRHAADCEWNTQRSDAAP